jgi:hypothetical protein
LLIGGSIGAALLGWLAYGTVTWLRYGQPRGGSDTGRGVRHRDPLLDRFIPTYEVAEFHEVRVAAPASVTYAATQELDLQRSRIVRAIFRGRELLLSDDRADDRRPRTFLAEVLALGWGVLAEEPGREIVLGAATRPWEANVRFRSLQPDEFAAFDTPGYAKIVWNLSVEPLGLAESVFRTETRVATTDAYARERFRRYWAVFSPGILLIRRATLRLVKGDAERRYRVLRAVEP